MQLKILNGNHPHLPRKLNDFMGEVIIPHQNPWCSKKFNCHLLKRDPNCEIPTRHWISRNSRLQVHHSTHNQKILYPKGHQIRSRRTCRSQPCSIQNSLEPQQLKRKLFWEKEKKSFWMLGRCQNDSYQPLTTQNQILYQFHSLPNPNTKPNSSL